MFCKLFVCFFQSKNMHNLSEMAKILIIVIRHCNSVFLNINAQLAQSSRESRTDRSVIRQIYSIA